jgi:hypothetical protein
MDLKFSGKLVSVGSSYMVTVPKGYIKNGMVDLDKEYEFIIKEADNNENNTTTP